MATTFRNCFLVNFAVTPDALARHLPDHLTPDLYEGAAYVSIVIAEMERMRPRVLPKPFGVTYTQVVYRAVVRCGSERGVTFLRSDADSPLMVAAGNALTFFRFHRAVIAWMLNNNDIRFVMTPADGATARIDAEYSINAGTTLLPPASRFSDLRSAQTFLTELYVAFGARRHDHRVEMVRIARSSWDSMVVHDRRGVYEAMTSGLLFQPGEADLDSVFYVRELDYQWEPLSIEAPT